MDKYGFAILQSRWHHHVSSEAHRFATLTLVPAAKCQREAFIQKPTMLPQAMISTSLRIRAIRGRPELGASPLRQVVVLMYALAWVNSSALKA